MGSWSETVSPFIFVHSNPADLGYGRIVKSKRRSKGFYDTRKGGEVRENITRNKNALREAKIVASEAKKRVTRLVAGVTDFDRGTEVLLLQSGMQTYVRQRGSCLEWNGARDQSEVSRG